MKQYATFLISFAFALFAFNTVYAAPLVYPAKGQSAEQQDQDKYQCYNWARDQTGVDPLQSTTQTVATTSRGGVVRGAAVGVGVGAIVGGSDGAKKGAAAGALVGGVRQNRRYRSAQASARQAQSIQQAQIAEYDRAFSVCMEGRGYSVR